MRSFALALVAALLLAIPATAADTNAAAGAPAPASGSPSVDYVLGSGDRLTMSVFGQPDLSVTVEVDPQGMIALPLIGSVQAGTRSVQQVTEEVRTRLDRDFLVNPRVTFEVINYRPYFILGEVNRPGSYPFVSGLDVRRAVATAGGYTRRADKTAFSVVRMVRGQRTESNVTEDDLLLPGDTITVGRRWF